MEFRYRAIDERRSRSPPPPVAPSTHGSGSADNHDGGGLTELMWNSTVTLWQSDFAPLEVATVDADKLRRQAEKARIRERILKEEAEHLELELEVRRELREEMLRLSRPALGRSGRGSNSQAPLSTGTITAANSSLPVVALEAHPKTNALATTLTKRKSLDHATEALLAPSSKKQKSTLTCMVCSITANNEKDMQCHLNGKVHKRKVATLPELPKLVTEIEQERGLEAGQEEEMDIEILGDYKPTKFMMETAAGLLNEVAQMDEHLLCELCNVQTKDCITMMCHLQGRKHISNAQKKRQPYNKPSGEAEGTFSVDPKKLVLEDFSVALPHTVRRSEGFILCELCDVKAPSMNAMHQHLLGKKHKNKVNASSDVSINVSTGGKEATKAKSIDIDMAVISNKATKVEAPLEKSLRPKLGDDSEQQELTLAPPKEDVATRNSAKVAGEKKMKNNATSARAQFNNVFDSDSLTMEVDSVMHPLSWVDGFLVCLSCDAKAPSETIMRSHLAGKKHKRKMTVAARGNNDLSILAIGADVVQDNNSKSTETNVEAGLVSLAVPQANTVANEEESALSLATSQIKNTIAMTSMEVDRPAEAQRFTCIVEPAMNCEITEEAEGEHTTFGSNGLVTQTNESMRTNGTTAPGKPMKIQVEGKVFTVMDHENGSLSCEVCGVHGCDKDNMILHLYTSMHWGKASLAEKKEKEQVVAMVDKDGKVGSDMASDGSGLLVD